MIFTPTNTIPGNFDAVSSEEIQNMVKKDIDPIPGASRTGRYSIIFTFEGEKSDVEWKYASASDRDTDYDAIVAAANAGGGGIIAPTTLQAVTDNGAETTNQVTFNSGSDRTFATSAGVSGEHGAEGGATTTWTIDNESGRGTFVDVYDKNGSLTSEVLIITILPASILTLGTVGAELIGAPGAGMYFDEIKIALEFIAGATPYTLGTGTVLAVQYEGGAYIAKADAFALGEADDAAWIITTSPNYEIADNPVIGNVEFNSAVMLVLQDDAGGPVDPTLGDGTFRAVITYKVREFGV
jgi:hypothetical protein